MPPTPYFWKSVRAIAAAMSASEFTVTGGGRTDDAGVGSASGKVFCGAGGCGSGARSRAVLAATAARAAGCSAAAGRRCGSLLCVDSRLGAADLRVRSRLRALDARGCPAERARPRRRSRLRAGAAGCAALRGDLDVADAARNVEQRQQPVVHPDLGQHVGLDPAAGREAQVVEHARVARVERGHVQQRSVEPQRDEAHALDERPAHARDRRALRLHQPLARRQRDLVEVGEALGELLDAQHRELDEHGADARAVDRLMLQRLFELLAAEQPCFQQIGPEACHLQSDASDAAPDVS